MERSSGPSPLFEPSLQSAAPPKANFSELSHYLVAFFGGPLAILIFGAQGADRIDRLRQDATFFGVIGALVLVQMGVEFWLLHGMASDSRPDTVLIGFGHRALALIWALLILRRYRRLEKAATLAGLETPNPWKTALISIAIAAFATRVVGAVITYAPA